MTLHKSARRLASVALIVAVTAACAKAQTRVTPPEGQFITLDGGRIHAVVQGSGPDLVLIHGANGNSRDFTLDLVGRMARDFRVIAMDRPGFGFSDPFTGPESPQEQARILRAAAAKLGVTKPIVLGHSYGGAVALAWALQGGDDTAALVLLAPASHPWPGDLGLLYRITETGFGQHILLPLFARLAPRSAMDRAVQGVFAPDPVPAGYVDHLGTDLTLNTDQLRLNARQINQLIDHVTTMSPDYPSLSLPIEVLHGTADKTVGLEIHSERLEAEVASAHLTRLNNVGHMPHHARPLDVAAAILRAAKRAGLK
jgi:pimeloyl-ACP methyl ester carboxylesterase